MCMPYMDSITNKQKNFVRVKTIRNLNIDQVSDHSKE